MTIDTFIEKQKEHNLKYTLTTQGTLRAESQLCPICELGRAMGRVSLYQATPVYLNCIAPDVGDALGISKDDCLKIIEEADGFTHGEIYTKLMDLNKTTETEIVETEPNTKEPSTK